MVDGSCSLPLLLLCMQVEFELLYYSFSGARIFFREARSVIALIAVHITVLTCNSNSCGKALNASLCAH